jgi:uncharacterized protein YbjT (DUF2867 family)
MQNSEIILVGGAGKTGKRVAARLEARGIGHRFASRSSSRPFDWQERATWRGALTGATGAYLTFQPDLAVAWAAEAIDAVARTALDCGLQHLVLLSGRGEERAQRSEEALRAAGCGYTILRASWFCQNFSEGAFAPSIATGELALPAGEVKEPFIDADDIADAVVAALTDHRHVGMTYELTGPRSITFREAVASIAEASGRPVAYRQISIAQFKTGLTEAGLPEATVNLLEELFDEVLDGRNSHVMDGVAEILGRPARDFSVYVGQAAAAGAWRAWP